MTACSALGSTAATRSPRPTPSRRSPAAARATASRSASIVRRDAPPVLAQGDDRLSPFRPRPGERVLGVVQLCLGIPARTGHLAAGESRPAPPLPDDAGELPAGIPERIRVIDGPSHAACGSAGSCPQADEEPGHRRAVDAFRRRGPQQIAFAGSAHATRRYGAGRSGRDGFQHEDGDDAIGLALVFLVVGLGGDGPLPPLRLLRAGDLAGHIVRAVRAVLQLDAGLLERRCSTRRGAWARRPGRPPPRTRRRARRASAGSCGSCRTWRPWSSG